LLILDTNVVSGLRRERPHPALLAWLDGIDPAAAFITTVTITEIQAGIERARRNHPETAQHVHTWLERILAEELFCIVAPDVQAARTLGRMIETPGLRGFLDQRTGSKKPKTGADLVIAAIAIANGAAVVTGNRRDFLLIHQHFPLPGLYDPFTGMWSVSEAVLPG
jgi:predicted nucleic acid-binding protein